MNSVLFLLSTVVNPENGGAATAPVVDAGTNAAPEASGFMGTIMQNPILMIVVYCIVIFGAMYFFSIKPQKKRERALNEMRSKVKAGDSVLLNNGMFGRIVDTTVDCFIVEFGTNKGVRIPVLKQEVALVREPNLSNKEEEPVKKEEPEKKSLFGFGKKKEEE